MPIPGEFLLDANAVIAFFANDVAFVAQFAAVPTYVPAIVIGELYFGAYKSGRVAANVARVDQFAAAASVLPVDAATAKAYGSVKGQLKAGGRMIPENDVWIAATALHHGLTLVTRDGHFGAVKGLSTAAW